MIKDLRKGGFAGAKARYSFRLVCICFGLIAVAALLCVLSGGIGLGAGAVLAGVVLLVLRYRMGSISMKRKEPD